MSAPDDDYPYEDEYEPDELEIAMGNCCQYVGADGHLYCGAIGSEDCDECPFQRDLGKKVAAP